MLTGSIIQGARQTVISDVSTDMLPEELKANLKDLQ